MNLPLANGRYIDQWETPIDEWLALAYGRDQLKDPIRSNFKQILKRNRSLLFIVLEHRVSRKVEDVVEM